MFASRRKAQRIDAWCMQPLSAKAGVKLAMFSISTAGSVCSLWSLENSNRVKSLLADFTATPCGQTGSPAGIHASPRTELVPAAGLVQPR